MKNQTRPRLVIALELNERTEGALALAQFERGVSETAAGHPYGDHQR